MSTQQLLLYTDLYEQAERASLPQYPTPGSAYIAFRAPLKYRFRTEIWTQKHIDLVRLVLTEYLARSDPRETRYRDLARQHSLLPILPEWTGFVGLREDGALFWVSDDDGSVSSEVNAHALHIAKVRGVELFSELGFLAPIGFAEPHCLYLDGCGCPARACV